MTFHNNKNNDEFENQSKTQQAAAPTSNNDIYNKHKGERSEAMR